MCNSSLGSVWSCNINWMGVAERFQRAEADFPCLEPKQRLWLQQEEEGVPPPFNRRRSQLIKRNGCNNINSKSDIPACAADIFIPPLCQTAARVAVTLYTEAPTPQQQLSPGKYRQQTDREVLLKAATRRGQTAPRRPTETANTISRDGS